jgi:hypothetical protein
VIEMSTVSWKAAVVIVLGAGCLPRPGVAQLSVGRGIVEREVAAGTRYRGSIPITNGSGEARRVRLYQADFTFDATGANHFEAPGTLQRSSAPWTTLGSGELPIPAGATVAVEYSVTVPERHAGKPEGSYWSVVMVEEMPTSPVQRRDAAREQGLGVRQVMRTAVVLVTHIAGTGAPELAFDAPRIVTENGGRLLQVDVRNTGTVAVRPALTSELFDAGGRSQGKVQGADRMLYPGTAARYRFDLGTIRAGRYTAVVLGDAGGDAVFGAQYGVTF